VLLNGYLTVSQLATQIQACRAALQASPAYAGTPLTYVDIMWQWCPNSVTLLPLVDFLAFNWCVFVTPHRFKPVPPLTLPWQGLCVCIKQCPARSKILLRWIQLMHQTRISRMQQPCASAIAPTGLLQQVMQVIMKR
jgi:hypothetical protein